MSEATVRQWLMEHTPLEPALLEGAGFDALVAERVAAVASGDEAEYIAALGRTPAEVERLAAEIAVPETWLFRYPNSFELLVAELRRRAAASATLRMCSIGCATGLEPYSMAMAAVHAGWTSSQVRIDALDRNPEALAIAAAGVYGSGAIRGEIPAWAAGLLEHEAGAIRIDDGVRAMVRFARVDVTSSGIEGPYDVIFCRNVLIYLRADARARLVRAICGALAPGGLLFVGHAEQFLRGEPMLRPVAAPHAFALQLVEATSGSPEALAMTAPAGARPAGKPRAAMTPPRPIVARTPAAPARPPDRPAGVSAGETDFAEARDLADAGRTAEAEERVRSLITRCGPSAAALELLGLIRVAADDAAGAKRLFEQAVYLEPTRAASLLHLAMISERAGDARHAAMYWDRARRAPTTQEHRA